MSFNENLPIRNIAPTGPRVKATCPNCNIYLVGDKCPKCDYVRVKGYNIEADTDMSKYGFKKILNWQSIVQDSKGKWHLVTTQFEATSFPCQSCKTSDWTWLMPQRTGVYKSCLGCQMTTGPVTMELGELVDDKIVKPEVIFELYKSRKLKPPKTLQEEIMSRKSRIRKQKLRGRNENVEVF